MSADFEKQLQRQPLRELPPEWRSEILAAVRAAQADSAGWESVGILAQLYSWLWPYQRGWAVLAAAWVVIFLLHFTAPNDSRISQMASVQSSQSMAVLQRQNLIMAELLNSMENEATAPVASPALPAPLKPRSERRLQQMAG
jgi:hypothetical protein